MTTVELAQYGIAPTRIRDLRDCGLADSHILVGLLNQAVQQFFALAPSNWRRTTVSASLPVPDTFLVTATPDSAIVAGSPFLVDYRGSTIYIDGDLRPNEVTGVNTLLNDYVGPSSGFKSATVYRDCLPMLDFAVDRIMTIPERIDATGTTSLMRLLDAGARTAGAQSSAQDIAWAPGYYDTLVNTDSSYQRNLRADYPTHCWLEHVGASVQVEHDAAFQLRLWPLPLKPFLLQFDVEMRPNPITLADLTTPTRLPVDTSLAHRTIIPLLQGLAAKSPLRSDDLPADVISGYVEGSALATSAIRALTPTFGPSQVSVGTPTGW